MIRSLKGGSLLVVLVAALATGLLVNPETANAYTGPPPWTNPALWSATESALMLPPTGLTTPGRIAVVAAGAEVGAVPASGAIALGMGTVVTASGALLTGYLLGTAADRWLGISAHFGSEPNLEVDAETHVWQITWVDTTGGAAGSSWPSNVGVIGQITFRSGLGEGSSGSTQPSLDPTTDYGYLPFDRLKVAQLASATAYDATCYHEVSYYCSWYVSPSKLSDLITDTELEPYTTQQVDEALTTWPGDDLPFDFDDPEAESAVEILDGMSEDDQLLFGQAIDEEWEGPAPDTFEMPDCSGMTYSDCLDALQDLGYVGTITETELGIDLADFDFDPGKLVRTNPESGTTGVASGAGVEFFMNPDPMPLELQAQISNETATDYAIRIGLDTDDYSITYTELPPGQEDPNTGPDGPVRVRMPIPGGGTRVVPVPHPGQGSSTKRVPVPDPADPPIEIEIFTNPPSMPNVPGPGDPGYPPGGGDGDCDCPPFDLSPITDIEYGDKFPFGFPVWAVEMLDDSDDVCPMFTITPPVQLSDEPIDISLCNEDWEETYQAPVFLLLKFLMTLGAIYFVCMRVLGLGSSSGDDDD